MSTKSQHIGVMNGCLAVTFVFIAVANIEQMASDELNRSIVALFLVLFVAALSYAAGREDERRNHHR